MSCCLYYLEVARMGRFSSRSSPTIKDTEPQMDPEATEPGTPLSQETHLSSEWSNRAHQSVQLSPTLTSYTRTEPLADPRQLGRSNSSSKDNEERGTRAGNDKNDARHTASASIGSDPPPLCFLTACVCGLRLLAEPARKFWVDVSAVWRECFGLIGGASGRTEREGQEMEWIFNAEDVDSVDEWGH
ncbi:hypothetical protein BDY21DRAFT_365107 [Lineolata rhizophorae]|uniref:Uncharacterized protein n=1 Tax=Lineolata rhizophorae TaxID=578093 RepID=A0A6A6NVT1_9PEZI|nr:hypothetical protein BDY21DRAFT_365107 [Lineolata rhizophorae]